jgi:hypothetical protein
MTIFMKIINIIAGQAEFKVAAETTLKRRIDTFSPDAYSCFIPEGVTRKGLHKASYVHEKTLQAYIIHGHFWVIGKVSEMKRGIGIKWYSSPPWFERDNNCLYLYIFLTLLPLTARNPRED